MQRIGRVAIKLWGNGAKSAMYMQVALSVLASNIPTGIFGVVNSPVLVGTSQLLV